MTKTAEQFTQSLDSELKGLSKKNLQRLLESWDIETDIIAEGLDIIKAQLIKQFKSWPDFLKDEVTIDVKIDENSASPHRLLSFSRRALSRVDLSNVNLSNADLSRANLSGANLSGANLSGANLSGANLSGANLRNANLQCAIFNNAIMTDADLTGASLADAQLVGTDLMILYRT